MTTVAIHESAISDKVIKFLPLLKFNTKIEDAYNNGNIYGFYYKNDIIYYSDIWGNEDIAGFDLSRLY